MSRTLARLVALWLASSLAACGPSGPKPVAALAQTRDAQDAMRVLREAWETSTPETRRALEKPLEEHMTRFEGDPTARTARAMLALVALEQGQTARARALAVPVYAGPEGHARDLAEVALAATLRLDGKAARAFERLRPLAGKLVDPAARWILNRELLLTGIEARRFAEASGYLRAFLREAGRDTRAATEREARALTARLPPEPLMWLLEDELAQDDPDPYLTALLTDHLATVSLEREDVSLARSLLDAAAPLLGDRADPLARLAARGASVRLERNTVGLLVPLRSDALRRRGVEVSAGLALALGLPGGRTRLVSRDDQGDDATIDDTLALLNADGAAVIVAGFDRKGADLALAYGERTGMPVLLLRAPSRPPRAGGSVFVLGDDPAQTRSALVGALAQRGQRPVALLVGEREGDATRADVSGDVAAVQPCGASLDFLRTSGARAVVLDGGAACTSLAEGIGLPVGWTLEASAEATRGLVASAGPFPTDPATKKDDALLAEWRARGRGEPSWWHALGHDAGLLAKHAVEVLPAEGAAEPDAAALAARKAEVARALASAEEELWTSDARGFRGGNVLQRSITVVERGAPARPAGAR